MSKSIESPEWRKYPYVKSSTLVPQQPYCSHCSALATLKQELQVEENVTITVYTCPAHQDSVMSEAIAWRKAAQKCEVV